MIMKVEQFNQNYTINRKTKTGVKATAKNNPVEPEYKTAAGEIYDASRTYYFFDESARAVRESAGFRRIDDHLCAFGLKIIPVARLHARQSNALAEVRDFVMDKINDLMAECNSIDDRIKVCIKEEKKNGGN